MSTLTRLEAWYLRQCNEDWEHTYGVTVGTLDNPGWALDVDLIDTSLESVPYVPVAENVGPDSNPEGNDWISCRVESGKWLGRGGPLKLERLVEEFVSWAERHDS